MRGKEISDGIVMRGRMEEQNNRPYVIDLMKAGIGTLAFMLS